jgi:cytochrome c553
MRHLPLLLILMLLGTACTDRMSPGDDRRGGRGELIAMSGGEGGARYACVTCHGAAAASRSRPQRGLSWRR